ncbi:GH92 family glycosyl hydrolase [Pseudoalteromonas luteoviolacea]|uniref:Alpha-1,2-mannosidase n=1 Tax=Pseudoalteromonas luteoviolacea S4054 TaxID=1129367 RepID=A0A0F6A759_9GAMM|nr:GH92 family glycosyl hydrolase [Pseudoalteromonas luteoviolacea]AOT10724.1 alpha-mannosidase [Pseudoalteromonas luteoviolacea]AOT16114.1 alpha-mannosidase [Pseudoalteromonas luteoviolacea]AOT20544.1 alpha-mannosidase [Pseudoalteromonas luteoviolacea]KKE81254.1 alpha-1,2-mannosidase [Pseudoalteromonas luteoviolacea S4054]KZN68983.1 alpha-1,2-mannosidase [Pseudoalteromonas luteoviolacea S4047-1]
MNYNIKKKHLIALSVSAALLVGCSNEQINTTTNAEADTEPKYVTDVVSYVNPLIGTKGPFNHRQAGNVTPGAVVPFGMFNFGPEHAYTEDLLAESEGISKKILEEKKRVPVSPGGYNYQASRVKGFSFTRLSGTGCLGASGDIPVMPFNKDITFSPATDPINGYYSAAFSHDNETAIPGYYQVGLDNGINVQLAATTRSGIANFTFDKSENAKLLFRTAYSQLGSGDAYAKVDAERGEITGYVTSGNFCGYLGEYNQRDYYTLHFVAKLDKPITGSGAWKNDLVEHGAKSSKGGMGYGDNGWPDIGKGSGVWVDLGLDNGDTVQMRVGISYVSLDNARENLAKEQSTYSFDEIREQSQGAWEKELSKVKVESEDSSKLRVFYTALYHSLFHPNVFSDVNGEYMGFDQKVHSLEPSQTAQYANFSGWDVYRSQLQLVTLLDQERGSDIAQSLFNQANQFNGIWDRWTHNAGPTGVMSGDPSTIAIANFVAFGADNFDVNGAYISLRKAAITPTEFDLSETGCPVFCRGQKPSLDQWQSLGYISDQSNSWEGASETLEQASSYFSLSQLADRLGKNSDTQRFINEAGYWRNIYNVSATESLGYIQGRNQDGTWKKEFDAFSGHLFVEGSPAQYLWMIPHDGAGLAEILGGDDAMTTRLDNHFKKPDGTWVLYRDSAEYADVSNQPSILSPWMYLHTGDAYKTQQTVRETMKQLWLDAPDGIPGQDDLGQMSSWYVFSSLGIYPKYPGRADLVLSSPQFTAAQIGNLMISAPDASDENIYIDALRVNGKPSLNSWIGEEYIDKTVTLDFSLSNSPNKLFGKAKENRPPSYSPTKS